MSEVVLDVRDLVVDGSRDRLLDGASIDVRRGERVGVVGGEEASRAALVAALLGDVEPPGSARGTVSYRPPDGEAADLLRASGADARRFRWRHVALVPATPSGVFNPVSSVGRSFEETLQAHGADVGEGMDRAANLLAELGLDPDAILDATPDEVGEGQLELAALALALLLQPDVLVVEESEQVLRLLASGAPGIDDDLTIVAVVSDPRLVAAFATRIAVLYDGQFVEVGPTGEVLEDPEHPYTRELLRML